MKKSVVLTLTALIAVASLAAQTPQKPQPEIAPDDIIRITTNLVQTDAVITDKNDQIIKDLKLEDFELYDNGKKQDIKFLEFVANADKRVEGEAPLLKNVDIPSAGLSAADLKRVVVFVIDDLTIGSDDLSRVRDLLRNFVNNQMQQGDLVAIVRVLGNTDLLGQYTSDKQMLLR